MKSRILLTSAIAALFAANLHANPIVPSVPDSGATVGMVGLGLLVLVALRRKPTK